MFSAHCLKIEHSKYHQGKWCISGMQKFLKLDIKISKTTNTGTTPFTINFVPLTHCHWRFICTCILFVWIKKWLQIHCKAWKIPRTPGLKMRKGPVSGLRQFLTFPLKMMKNAFHFTLKSSFCSWDIYTLPRLFR